jgi:hypothetical protein
METVRAAANPVLQNEYLVRCVQLTGVPEETLRIELRRTGKGRSVLGRQAVAGARANNAAERELVALAIGSESVRQALREQIAPADLQDRDCRELLETVFDALDETDAITAEVILRRIERPELARLVSEVTLDGPRAESSPQAVEQLVNKVLEPRRKNRLKELKQLIDDASRAGPMDPALIEEYRSLRSTLRHWR